MDQASALDCAKNPDQWRVLVLAYRRARGAKRASYAGQIELSRKLTLASLDLSEQQFVSQRLARAQAHQLRPRFHAPLTWARSRRYDDREVTMVSRVIKGKYKKGVFEPLEPVTLPEDEVVDIVVPERPTNADDAAFLSSLGSWEALVPEEFIEEV